MGVSVALALAIAVSRCREMNTHTLRVDTVLSQELFGLTHFRAKNCSGGHSSRVGTVRRIWFVGRNCSEDLVPDRELCIDYSSCKGTVCWVQFFEKIRFIEPRAVVGLLGL